MSKQPRDDGNDPIPVLGFRFNAGHQVPFTTATSNVSQAMSNSVRVVTIYSTQDCFIETHVSNTVVANTQNSHFIPKTVPYDISLGPEVVASENDRFIAVIGDTSDGKLYISERQ